MEAPCRLFCRQKVFAHLKFSLFVVLLFPSASQCQMSVDARNMTELQTKSTISLNSQLLAEYSKTLAQGPAIGILGAVKRDWNQGDNFQAGLASAWNITSSCSWFSNRSVTSLHFAKPLYHICRSTWRHQWWWQWPCRLGRRRPLLRRNRSWCLSRWGRTQRNFWRCLRHVDTQNYWHQDNCSTGLKFKDFKLPFKSYKTVP